MCVCAYQLPEDLLKQFMAVKPPKSSRCLEDKLPSNSSYKVRMCIMHAWLFGSPLPLRRRDSAGEGAPGKPGCTPGGRVAVSSKGVCQC